MIDEELFLAHSIYSNKGAFALLIGSGISRGAGIPTGWEVMMELIKRLSILKKQVISGNPEDWYVSVFGKELNYSSIIEALTKTKEERLNLLKPFFEATGDDLSQGIKQPTKAHRAIAKLIQRGYIRVVITTNFDRLLENALRELGIEATIISNPVHIDNVMPLIHSSITIIKVNGDYLDTHFLNIESELSVYDSRLVDQLKFIFENFGLVTAGWSAQWDTALNKILIASNKYRFSNFFTYKDNLEAKLEKISMLRNGKLIKLESADDFFSELVENIEALQTGENINPLSKPIAIARLKKYIIKPEFKILLYELIRLQAESDYEIINNQISLNPTKEFIREIIEFKINRLDLLWSLLAEGVYWGTPNHYDIWSSTISKFSHPIRQNTGYAIWNSLSYLPALLLFYAAGLVAILRQDFKFLEKLFSIQIYNPNREGERVNILKIVNTMAVMKSDIQNEVFETNQYVPMSELLYKTLKHRFRVWVADEKEYDEIFDSFELLISLQHIKHVGKVWFPYGRFVYRSRSYNNIINTKAQQLKNEQLNLDWIKGGLFEDPNTLLEFFQFFDARINEMNIR